VGHGLGRASALCYQLSAKTFTTGDTEDHGVVRESLWTCEIADADEV
jgi:hypothetical protein